MKKAKKLYYLFKFITDYFCKTPWTLNHRLFLDLDDAERFQKPSSGFPDGPSLIISKGSCPNCIKQVLEIELPVHLFS